MKAPSIIAVGEDAALKLFKIGNSVNGNDAPTTTLKTKKTTIFRIAVRCVSRRLLAPCVTMRR